ncbi:MAG: hypothetical protein ACLFRL_08990 [Desulfohalobiaceae bacterium]
MAKQEHTSQVLRMVKPAALALVLALVVLLFWLNFDYSLQMLEPAGNIKDRTDSLTQEQTEHLQDFSQALQEHFDLEFKLLVGQNALQEMQPEPGAIYLALEPEAQKWALSLPPLLKQALPQDFVAYLQQEHFRPYLQSGDWPRGLMDFAHSLWQQLQKMHKQEEYAE